MPIRPPRDIMHTFLMHPRSPLPAWDSLHQHQQQHAPNQCSAAQHHKRRFSAAPRTCIFLPLDAFGLDFCVPWPRIPFRLLLFPLGAKCDASVPAAKCIIALFRVGGLLRFLDAREHSLIHFEFIAPRFIHRDIGNLGMQIYNIIFHWI